MLSPGLTAARAALLEVAWGRESQSITQDSGPWGMRGGLWDSPPTQFPFWASSSPRLAGQPHL